MADQTVRVELLDEVLANSHPLMVEGFFLAAVPFWYGSALFAAMRHRADERDAGIVERVSRFSFVATLEDGRGASSAYTVHPVQRAMLNERWIAQDAVAYREAHRRALVFWETYPDPDPEAQARNLLYHRLFVDTAVAAEYLISLFRASIADRQLAAGERMLATTREARHYLLLLGDPLPAGFDDLLAHLETRLGQKRGRWAESLEPLEELRSKKDLPARLLPYIIRAHGDALANTGNYVAAIEDYKQALALFDRQAKAGVDPGSIQTERADTLISQGDAYAGLARAARGHVDLDLYGAFQGGRRDAIQFVLALPLVIYLSRYLGPQMWHPRFWGVVSGLDWIVARLIVKGATCYQQADPILERHGRPSEGVAADEKLAALYLELGDARHAEALYTGLLDVATASLSEYRQAIVRLGLGRTLLAQGRPAEARPHLEAALPLLRRYEDAAGEALAELTLADALAADNLPGEALPHYSAAQVIYEKQENRVGVTQVGERLDALSRAEGLALEGRTEALRAAEAIAPRHYPVRFRHPATLYFQRAMVIMLAVVVFLIPIVAIRLDTGIVFEPEITFHAAPLLDNTADFNPNLSQTVQKLGVDLVPDPNVLWQAGVLLLLLYLVLSALTGLLVITRTSLSSVQAATYADLVRLDRDSIRTGEGASRREVTWPETQELVRANVYPARQLWRDNSQSAVAAPDQRVIIMGRTAWYESLLDRIEQRIPSGARRTNVSFSLIRSKMGALYLFTLATLLLLSVLSVTKPDLLFAELAGLPYSLTDLYPYFYLGLFLPPMVWLVVQPLHQRRHIDPGDVRPALILGGLGLALAALRIVTRFRPWLTVPDIYPTLAVIILVGSAAITLLAAHRAAGDRLPVWARSLGAVLAIAVLLVMGAQLWREVVSYHYLIRGNHLRDQALAVSPASPDPELLERAKDAYGRALVIADTPILGMEGRTALRGGPGLPSPDKSIWATATNSRAVMRLLLEEDRAAILDDYDALLQETQHPAVYLGRAMARLRAGSLPPAEALNAVADLTRAIEQEPGNAKYFLWRGFARHSLGSTDLDLDRAKTDYQHALDVSGEGELSAIDRATALTGLGWVDFGRGMQQPDGPERRGPAEAASGLFRQAIDVNPTSADAWLGLGYAVYTLRKYDEALAAWNQTEHLRPGDPSVQLSLGALYWRAGTLVEGYMTDDGKDKPAKEYCRENFSLDQRTTSETHLKRSVDYWNRALELSGLDDKAKARTYSGLGQIYYLMQACPNLEEVDMLEKAVHSNDVARELDPTNAAWPFRSGRLANNLFLVLRNQAAGPDLAAANWALRTMQDYDRSVELSTDARGLGIRQGDKISRLGDARDYARLGLLAAQGALAAGDVDRAMQWFDVSLALAARTGISPLETYSELEKLGAWLAAHPEAEADALRRLRERTLQAARTQSAAVATFLDGLAALKADRIGDATELYRQGVEQALAQGDLASIAAAATALRYEPDHDAGPVFDSLRQALPRVEQAARSEALSGSVDAAVRTAVLAAALEDAQHPGFATAGWWLNETARRTAKDTLQFYPALYPARDHFRTLWAATGVRDDDLLAGMDGQLDELFSQAPEAEQDGLFWRYRAWLKYHVGLSAFRLNNETAAQALLQSGMGDATRANQISDSHRNVYTYLPESGWGAYHVERGDAAFAQGNLAAALADYEAAFNLIKPKDNSGSTSQKVIAAFRAGYTALQLGQLERAASWYQQAIGLAEKAKLQVQLESEMVKLQTLLRTNIPEALVSGGGEILLQIRAAYDRLERR